MGERQAKFDEGLVDAVRGDLKKGTAKGSLREDMLRAREAREDEDLTALSERHLAGIPATLFGAGSLTTASSLKVAVLALLQYPSVFLAAQQEIDMVVGKDRSPTFEDRERLLPYLEALVKETLRWKPVVPLNLAHATTEEDVFERYRIPKGTIVTVNTWAVNHHPSYFPSPEEFAPERFLAEDDRRFRTELKGKMFPGKYGQGGFGWGRRICVGADLAGNGMWIVLAKLIWAFALCPVVGERYEDVELEGEPIAFVGRFKCIWKVRSLGHREVIVRDMKEAEGVLEMFPAFD